MGASQSARTALCSTSRHAADTDSGSDYTEDEAGAEIDEEFPGREPAPKSQNPLSEEFPAILQFTSPLYFVEEDEGSVKIDVMRLGTASQPMSCFWHTEDGSGKAGQRYEAAEGHLDFAVNDIRKSLEVPIIKDPLWNATLEFRVVLTDAVGCQLGVYLHTCRVKVIDNDLFPSSKFPQVDQGLEAIASIGTFRLFWEYFKLIVQRDGMMWRTIACIFGDQLENVYVIYKLWATVFLLNVVFAADKDDSQAVEEHEYYALLIGLGFILPIIAIYCWKMAKIHIDLKGHVFNLLQRSLVRKYLNYSAESRQAVTATSLQLAVRDDCVVLASGYVSALNLVKVLFKLGVMLAFTLNQNPDALSIAISMPILIFAFGYARLNVLARASEALAARDLKMLICIQEITDKYRLIANYFQRPKANEKFSRAANELREARIAPDSVALNNEYFTYALGPLFTGGYTLLYARSVLLGYMDVGTFMATLGVFGEIAGDFSSGYTELMKISALSTSLEGLVDLFNNKTDLRSWKAVNRRRRQDTKDARDKLFSQPSLKKRAPYLTDLLEFAFKDLCFAHPDGYEMFRNVNLTTKQGTIVAIQGDHTVGRQTFLRLIGHEIFPTQGSIFIPTHLRILHVAQAPCVLDDNLYHNLTFGGHANFDRIINILTMLRAGVLLTLMRNVANKAECSSELSDVTDSDDSGDHVAFKLCLSPVKEKALKEDADNGWQKTLSYTDLVKLHLARAFIMNPEVMVLQRPLSHFDPDQQSVFMDVVRQHVQGKGLYLPKAGRSARRPRTVFISVENADHARQADVVWRVERVKDETYSSVTDVTAEVLGAPLAAPLGSHVGSRPGSFVSGATMTGFGSKTTSSTAYRPGHLTAR
eukprot:TRINITY_DN71762_c0_g1_i1.p1 TRINITY_DN71762_c0_g1~~TRINITY_DN71762_c0_g1_i1.p1  ORF type:complete len:872 (+),score=144.38 TRINITY_DN71762_c0_g1_i1:79-2694(+)